MKSLCIALLGLALVLGGGCARLSIPWPPTLPGGSETDPEPPPVTDEPLPEPEPFEMDWDPLAEQAGVQHLKFEAMARGWAEIETLDMMPPRRAANGDLENFFLALRGPGSKRLALINMANNEKTRSIRCLMTSRGPSYDRKRVHDNHLPGWVKWRIEWEAGESRCYCAGKLIAKGPHRGMITEAWAGTWERRRNWPGTWRGLRVGVLP